MNNEIKIKWLEALRSGEFKQGAGYLKSGDAFCCLGVLCAIQGADFEDYELFDDLETSTLPAEFNADLLSEDREFLAEMNDGGTPFHQIADHIEANL